MTTDETTPTPPSPFSRPSFVLAGIVVGLVLILGAVLLIKGAVDGDDPPATPSPNPSQPVTSSTSPAASPSSTGLPAGEASLCGLPTVMMSGQLTSAPAADWAYDGTTAYPTSKVAGPGATSGDGVRHCFARTPEGAVFAAANAVAAGTAADLRPWLTYFVAKADRDAVLAQGSGSGSTDTETRSKIVGFRLLAYDGTTARVDMAATAYVNGQTITISMVYDLIWEDGDWHLSVPNPTSPINVAQIPDTTGYIAWEE